MFLFLAECTCLLCFTADLWLRGPPYAPVQTANGEPHHTLETTSSLVLTQVFYLVCCVAPLLILFCVFSPLCRITMESHSLVPQRLSLPETGA